MKKFEKEVLVTKSFLPPFEEYMEEIKKIWESNWLTNNGPLHNELQLKLNNFLGVKNSVLFTNGHLALDVAIKSLNLTGEVITTPFTFASTTHAITMNGLKPVFCDINMDDYTMDVSKIEGLITKDTSAIIPVHVFGNPCNVYEIERIATKHNLKVIYDAAHTFGVEVNGRGIGSFGDVAMFSLHATKIFNTIEGGLLTFNSGDLTKSFNLYKNFGITGPETVEAIGLNAKMSEFQAAMGIVNLRYVEKEIAERKRVTEVYRENLRNIEGIKFLEDKEGVKPNYSYFPIVIDEEKLGVDRNVLAEKLKEFNVFVRKYFYPLISDFECYRNEYNSELTPCAKYVAERVVTLPMYGSLTNEEIIKICDIIRYISGK